MINDLFPILEALDGAIESAVPLALRLVLWGGVAGGLAMAAYRLLANQAAIRRIKSEIRDLRRRMFDLETSQEEFWHLIRRNLVVSFSLVGATIGPALASAIPVMFVVAWLDLSLSYAAPHRDEALRVTLVPPGSEVRLAPRSTATRMLDVTGTGLQWGLNGELRVTANGREIYVGNPFSPPTSVIGKRRWWHSILANPAGYIDPRAGISEIRIHLSRRRVLPAIPDWAAGWETPFFVSVLLTALGAKFVFRIV